MKINFRRKLRGVLYMMLVAGLLAVVMPVLLEGPREVKLASPKPVVAASSEAPAPTLKVMTLNLAHGRAEAWHQAFLDKDTIQSNLDAVAEILRRERPDAVALQEADGPSVWSGRFNHVDYLARKAELPCRLRAENVKGLGLSYGAALLSRLPARDAVAVTFAPSPPTLSKGFLVSTVDWPGRPEVKVNLVSVHLDFSRESVRKKQIQDIAARLAKRPGEIVIMGDFNGDWSNPEGPLRLLADELHLKAFEPTAEMNTFPDKAARLDWILISSGLEFVESKALPDAVSDHRGVTAVLRIAK